MVLQSASELRVNARATDAFDLFNFKHYAGPNPYLNQAACVFDFALTGNHKPCAIADYKTVVGAYYPHILEESFESYAAIFARTVAEANRLDMDLHFKDWSLQPCGSACERIAIEALHARTSRSLIYTIWDWFEAITRQQPFPIQEAIADLQAMFRSSVYGGPTVYALWKTAHELDIPAFYLWDEGLMQYGYGKHQIRGVATTFDHDSHLDSDFTTRKDDCKRFLSSLGFPVPEGEIVYTCSEAIAAARRLGYPVAIKPVVGHKGIGVTADIHNREDLEAAFDRAVEAIVPDQPPHIIIEQSITGKDYRLLCVNGRFVAATERSPAFVVGDGRSTIQALIDAENSKPERSDTPTSPMSKIQCDEAMGLYLQEQKLSLNSVLDPDERVYLRKVANLSSGGFSIDATAILHPDNIILAQDVAQYFRLTCLGIDVIAADLSRSWKEGQFGILEINAAPGIFMHLRPAVGESVDVPAYILKTFFRSGAASRIPIISLNRLQEEELLEMIDAILLQHPDRVIGGVCQQAVYINRSPKEFQTPYNLNVQNLLRHPKVDLLIAAYAEAVFSDEGQFYDRSNLFILNHPTSIEKTMVQASDHQATIVLYEDDTLTIQRNGLVEQFPLEREDTFQHVCLQEIMTLLNQDNL